jgi:hypothetical protein
VLADLTPSYLTSTLPVFLFNGLEIIGFYTAVWYKQADTEDHEPIEESKMALWWIKFQSLKHLGEFWSKPFCTCPPCMASLHSLWYWVFLPFTTQYLIVYPIYILALCGMMKLIVTKFDI